MSNGWRICMQFVLFMYPTSQIRIKLLTTICLHRLESQRNCDFHSKWVGHSGIGTQSFAQFMCFVHTSLRICAAFLVPSFYLHKLREPEKLWPYFEVRSWTFRNWSTHFYRIYVIFISPHQICVTFLTPPFICISSEKCWPSPKVSWAV